MDCNGLYTLLDNIRVQIYDKHDKIYELQALSVNCISVNVQIIRTSCNVQLLY